MIGKPKIKVTIKEKQNKVVFKGHANSLLQWECLGAAAVIAILKKIDPKEKEACIKAIANTATAYIREEEKEVTPDDIQREASAPEA